MQCIANSVFLTHQAIEGGGGGALYGGRPPCLGFFSKLKISPGNLKILDLSKQIIR